MTAADVLVAPLAWSESRLRVRSTGIDWHVIAVAALTLLALGLRVALMRDSLAGDELYMFNIVHNRSLGQAFHIIRETEKTPPLYFLLAWVTSRIGDPTLWIRLPSLLFGTALVPLAYALGRRTVGRTAGVVAAAILALSGYSIFYGTEARGYSALAFLAGLSTFCLLEAIHTGRRRWWAAYGAAVVAVMYTHYMGIFVLIVQAAWALWTHREQLREQLVVYGVAVVAYAPWLPSYLLQQSHSDDEAHRIAQFTPPTLSLFAQNNIVTVFGNPFISLSDLPGRPLVALGLAVIGFALIAALLRWLRTDEMHIRLASPKLLIALLALASPVGVGLLSARPGLSFLIARNLIASLIPLALIIGWLVTSMRPRYAIAATAALLFVVGTCAVETLNPANRRTPYRASAHYIDARARPGDPIIWSNFIDIVGGPLSKVLAINLRHPHPVAIAPAQIEGAWAAGRRGADVFVVEDLPGVWKSAKQMAPRSGPGNAFILVAERHYVGLSDVLVGEYRLASPSAPS